ncbi:hypothetical protein [Azohydromonas aeria]|uniref:hypothetical protein n=1 Tax=Azohydromonas aeria TaxID=2590212 RepID=UPI0012FB75AB|nr:hypothetical protein [Azohydromonas aeria]
MDKTAKPARQFSHLGAAWYAHHVRAEARIHDEITLTVRTPKGSGEIVLQWRKLDRGPAPCLRVFHDSWAALAQCPDLLAAVAEMDGRDVTPQAMCDVLLALGFVDATPREMLAAHGF